MLAAPVAILLRAQDVPVEAALPSGWDATRPSVAVRLRDGREFPTQAVGDRVIFLAPREKTDYSIREAPKPAESRVTWVDTGKNLTLRVGDRNVLRYNYSLVNQPDPVFSRSGYIHPLWTPSGKMVTNDSPPNHLHHHGIWSAWTSSEFEGRKSNFWESAEKQGRVECIRVESTTTGPVFGGFKARHRFINLNGPDGPKTAIEETWEVRVYAVTDRFIFDLVSTQTCATGQPLVIKEYRYGGIGFRGAHEWEGKTGAMFLTSGGKDRLGGHATKAKWCVVTGKIEGADASVGFLCHPSDFRFPQPLRIHPDEPFFNWAVPQGGPFSIEPGTPYVARYRFIVTDGALGADVLETDWDAYGNPAEIHFVVRPK